MSKDIIREAAFHALEAKFKVGLFDDPYLYFNEKREKEVIGSERNPTGMSGYGDGEHGAAAKQNDVLPLSTDKKIAVGGLCRAARDADGQMDSQRRCKQGDYRGCRNARGCHSCQRRRIRLSYSCRLMYGVL